ADARRPGQLDGADLALQLRRVLPLPAVRLLGGDAADGGARRDGGRHPRRPPPAATGAGVTSSRPVRVLQGLALAVAVVIALVPILLMIETSFKSNKEITESGTLYPHAPTLGSYRSLFSGNQFGAYLKNSIGITAISVLVALVLGSLAAYSLARFRL